MTLCASIPTVFLCGICLRISSVRGTIRILGVLPRGAGIDVRIVGNFDDNFTGFSSKGRGTDWLRETRGDSTVRIGVAFTSIKGKTVILMETLSHSRLIDWQENISLWLSSQVSTKRKSHRVKNFLFDFCFFSFTFFFFCFFFFFKLFSHYS